jgi:uncharacterized protein (DUF4213/DUF364 family)
VISKRKIENAGLRKKSGLHEMHSRRFSIYDGLIDGIPSTAHVLQCICGIHWTAVRSEAGIGLAMSPQEGERRSDKAGAIAGRRVNDVAEWSKSWNALEAAVGVAAINSWYNAPSTLESAIGPIDALTSENSVFAEIGPIIAGKKVTVIGHFPDLDQIAPVCSLSILERNPCPGDFPDPACEFILPKQDFVFMTGVTLINKTFPRLLELSQNAQVVLVGPSVPLTPLFFDHGVTKLAGTIVCDGELIFNHVMEGGDRSIFNCGAKRIRLDKTMFHRPRKAFRSTAQRRR